MRLSQVLAGATFIGLMPIGTSRSQAPDGSSAKPMSYEVVSIKPSKPGTPVISEFLPNGFRETDTTLGSLVQDAFGIFYDKRILGMPSWAESEQYDIEAKIDADTADRWKRLTEKQRHQEEEPMLQAVLVERCKLKVHFEKKEMPVYELVIAKSGLKMKEAPKDEAENEELSMGITLTAHAISIENLTVTLSGVDGRPVVDKTELGEKRFDFKLHWTPDNLPGNQNSGPSLFTAVEEQLGLKLIPSKARMSVLVIDRTQRPSPN